MLPHPALSFLVAVAVAGVTGVPAGIASVSSALDDAVLTDATRAAVPVDTTEAATTEEPTVDHDVSVEEMPLVVPPAEEVPAASESDEAPETSGTPDDEGTPDAPEVQEGTRDAREAEPEGGAALDEAPEPAESSAPDVGAELDGQAVEPDAASVAPESAEIPPGEEATEATPEDSGDGTVGADDLTVPEATSGGGTERDASGDADAARPSDQVEPAPAGEVVADRRVAADRVESPVVEVEDFQTLGVTWPAGSSVDDLQVEVRTRSVEGWTEWTELEVADEAPDGGTPDADSAARGGTSPLWVGESEAIQVAFAASEAGGPADMSLTLVSSEEVETPSGVETAGTGGDAVISNASFTGTVLQAASAPRIITRGEWGAPRQICTPSVASKLVGAVVHHTAGSNSYSTVGQAMQQIRNDAAYHINGRKWCDLGYNFVVDKWGNIYEGRAHSLTRPVIGVHAGGFNTGTVGVAMLGTYNSLPSAATQRAVGQIIGLRLGAYGVNPQSSMSYYTGAGQNSRYQNQTVNLPRIFGHGTTAYTACPGAGGYAALPSIRSTAATYASTAKFEQAESVIRAMYKDLLNRAPDTRGLEEWKLRLVSGASAPTVAAQITKSEEYNRRKIAEAYRTVLGRSTDEAGVRSWLAAINRGTVKIDEIANHLVVSEEFYLRSGRNDARLVRNMYTSVLGRQGSSAEISYWTSRIPSLGRAGVITSIMGSREAAQRKVQQNYRLFLNRMPDVRGMNHWTDIHLARGEAAVRANIVGSTEYRMRAEARFP